MNNVSTTRTIGRGVSPQLHELCVSPHIHMPTSRSRESHLRLAQFTFDVGRRRTLSRTHTRCMCTASLAQLSISVNVKYRHIQAHLFCMRVAHAEAARGHMEHTVREWQM
jgi:hypothetical protein